MSSEPTTKDLTRRSFLTRVGEFFDKGFTFISLGNDLHHVLTQAGAYMKDVTATAKDKTKQWQPRASALL